MIHILKPKIMSNLNLSTTQEYEAIRFSNASGKAQQ